jgi:hypothetical protein
MNFAKARGECARENVLVWVPDRRFAASGMRQEAQLFEN